MLAATCLPENALPREKYVFKPLPGSSHQWAIEFLRERAQGASVLDVGAGGGGMGRTLREFGASNLTAIEIDATTRDELRADYGAVHESLDCVAGQRFDVILFLDVLEHMVDPFSVVRDVASYLTPGGVALISVPNVAHWSVRLPLLFGSFTYSSRGILDRTHLQFFTRRRFLEMLRAGSGCSIAEVSSSIEPAELALPKHPAIEKTLKTIAPARISIARALPGLMAYQHLGVLRKDV